MDEKYSGRAKRPKNRFFLVALAVCVVAIAGVAVATFSNPSTDIDEPDPPSVTGTTTTTMTTSTTSSTMRPTTKTTAKPVVGTPKELYVLPCSNEVLRPFSGDVLVYSPTMKDWRTHNGTDFTGTIGQSVKAAADGTIQAIKTDPLWGDVIEIKGNSDTVIRYCGAKAATDLKVGQTVKAGDAIATLAEVPCEAADKPHLHLEILRKKAYVDPVEFIGRAVKNATTTTTNKTTTTIKTTTTTKK